MDHATFISAESSYDVFTLANLLPHVSCNSIYYIRKESHTKVGDPLSQTLTPYSLILPLKSGPRQILWEIERNTTEQNKSIQWFSARQ